MKKKSNTAALLDDEVELGEEDTDEEEEEGEENERSWQDQTFYFRGPLGFDADNNIVRFRGKWLASFTKSVTEEQISKGDSFSTSMKLKDVSDEIMQKAKDGVPINGDFSGHYVMDMEGESSKFDDGYTLQFHRQESGSSSSAGDRYQVTGDGENQFGTFELKGEYDSSSRILSVGRRYIITEDEDAGDNNDIDDDIDDTVEEDDGPDEDANLSVEELRKKYYESGALDAVGSTSAVTSEPARKKPKTTKSASIDANNDEDVEEF